MHRNGTRPGLYCADDCTRGPMIVRWFVGSALALLPAAAVADPSTPMSCPQALEQITTLRTMAPVYKLVGADQRHYIEDADRPAELAHLQRLAGAVCSTDPKAKKLQHEEAARLHLALSPECAIARDQLAAMQSRSSRESARSIEQQRRLVATNCPLVDAKDRWLLQWDGRRALLPASE
jgi:hypothetical protein